MPEEIPSSTALVPDQTTSSNANAKKKMKKRRGGGAKDNKSTAKSTSNFEGETEKMNGHIFSTPEESNDPMEFIQTAEMAKRFMNKEYDLIEISTIFEDPPVNPSIETPPGIQDSSSQLDKDLYLLRLKAYLAREYNLQTAM